MTYKDELYLVRHGEYGRDHNLNAMGREVHAPSARDNLVNLRGLGSNAVLLSSDAPRAAQTAEIIGEGLGVKPVMSALVNEAGNSAWLVSDLDAVIEEALDLAGVEINEESQDLVVVTHAPMLAVARGVDSRDIRYGEVLAYARNSWNNPEARK